MRCTESEAGRDWGRRTTASSIHKRRTFN